MDAINASYRQRQHFDHSVISSLPCDYYADDKTLARIHSLTACFIFIFLHQAAILPCVLLDKYTYILAQEMASSGNRHCANCIGTLSFAMHQSICRLRQCTADDTTRPLLNASLNHTSAIPLLSASPPPLPLASPVRHLSPIYRSYSALDARTVHAEMSLMPCSRAGLG